MTTEERVHKLYTLQDEVRSINEYSRTILEKLASLIHITEQWGRRDLDPNHHLFVPNLVKKIKDRIRVIRTLSRGMTRIAGSVFKDYEVD